MNKATSQGVLAFIIGGLAYFTSRVIMSTIIGYLVVDLRLAPFIARSIAVDPAEPLAVIGASAFTAWVLLWAMPAWHVRVTAGFSRLFLRMLGLYAIVFLLTFFHFHSAASFPGFQVMVFDSLMFLVGTGLPAALAWLWTNHGRPARGKER